MFQVAGSESTRTGVAPACTMAAAQEMMVNVGIMTSSPGPRSRAVTAATRAAEPLQTAMPYFRPTRFAIPSSRRCMNGPSEEIHPVSMHSARYFFSLPSSNGSFTGMNCCAIKLLLDFAQEVSHAPRPVAGGFSDRNALGEVFLLVAVEQRFVHGDELLRHKAAIGFCAGGKPRPTSCRRRVFRSECTRRGISSRCRRATVRSRG